MQTGGVVAADDAAHAALLASDSAYAYMGCAPGSVGTYCAWAYQMERRMRMDGAYGPPSSTSNVETRPEDGATPREILVGRRELARR